MIHCYLEMLCDMISDLSKFSITVYSEDNKLKRSVNKFSFVTLMNLLYMKKCNTMLTCIGQVIVR